MANDSNQAFNSDMVSVIIPAYNAAATLGDQLDALRAQVYGGNWEIIVVDNGSTDGTAGLVERYRARLPRLRLVKAVERRGAAYARNAGVAAACGDRLLFCDADDVVAPGWLAALAEALKTHDLVSGSMDELMVPGRPARTNTRVRAYAAGPFLRFLPFAIGCNFGVTRRAFEAAGGFSPQFRRNQDVEFSWRLQLQRYKLHYVPGALIHSRPKETGRSVWSIGVGSGEAEVLLYRQFAAAGMPRTSVRGALRRYAGMILKLTRLPGANDRQKGRLLRRAGTLWGRLRGSVRYRKLYL